MLQIEHIIAINVRSATSSGQTILDDTMLPKNASHTGTQIYIEV